MRFRKRIKIAPGINLNLSGSGVSTTIGPRGANVNIGKKGAYLNTGVPGTGLYNRTKISSSSQTHRSSNQTITNSQSQVNVKLDLNEDYEPIITIYNQNGVDITDESKIARIKRKPEYKENVKKLYLQAHEEIQAHDSSFTKLHLKIESLISINDTKNSLASLSLEKYKVQLFPESRPLKERTRYMLELESKKIKSIKFWENKKRRKEFVENNLEERYNSTLNKWIQEKKKFDDNEKLEESNRNKEFLNTYNAKKATLQKFLDADTYLIHDYFQTVTSELDLEPEFAIDFEFNQEEKTFYLDVDLPEVEHIPNETSKILASGKISVKQKTQKQIDLDYAHCVTGLSYYIASLAFNCSPAINKVVISGYTQRINKSTGHLNDDYILSAIFRRELFSVINFKNVDPIDALENFEHRKALSKMFKFGIIEPYSKD